MDQVFMGGRDKPGHDEFNLKLRSGGRGALGFNPP